MGRQRSTVRTPFDNLTKGSHICYFYLNSEELSHLVITYFQAGLANNEKCLWICAEPLDAKTATHLLRVHYPELDRYLERGQLVVMDYDRLYVANGQEFDVPTVLNRWAAEASHAITQGFDGLRVAGDLSWLKSIQALKAYEERFCTFSLQTPIVALCCYPLARMNHVDILDISYVHHFVVAPQGSSWRLVPSARHRDLLWHSLVESLTRGMLAIDASGTIITATNMLLELFGCTRLSCLGADIKEFATRFKVTSMTGRVRPDTVNLMSSCDLDDYWKATSPAHGDMEFLVNIKGAKPNGIIPEVLLLIFHDITGLRTVDTIEGNFLQVVSHELKNPIQTMTALINLMKASVDDRESPVYKYIQMADSCLARISGVLEDLQSVGQIRRDTAVINPIPADLTSLVLEALEPYLTNPKHTFICKFDKTQYIPAMVDPVRIHQILANVLNNAIKYTPQGKRIWLDLEVSNGAAVLVVEDEGIGILPTELELVFEQFYRGTKTRGSFPGIGLGLYVSRCLARMHGGDLWAETRPHGGALIKLSLPVSHNDTQFETLEKETI